MGLDQICRKKDKRLLVLLALGILILFSGVETHPGSNPGANSYFWLEIQGSRNRLFRIELKDFSSETNGHLELVDKIGKTADPHLVQSLFNMINQESAFALVEEESGEKQFTSLSPRLAFFLGKPFSINTATSEDLVLIPGIGPTLAGNIIEHRERHGPITNAYGLEAVPGIGSRTKELLQDYFIYSVDNE